MTDLAKIVIESKDNSGSGFNSATANLQRLSDMAGGAGSRLLALGAVGVVAAGIGGIGAITLHALEAADQVGKLAQKTGMAVEDISALSYAAKLSDVDVGQLSKGIKGLSEKMVMAGDASSESGRLMKMMGVDLTTGTGPALEKIADYFQQLPDGATKTTLAVKLFGKAGQDMIPMLNEGGDGIRRLKGEAGELGVVMKTETAAAAQIFNDNMRALKTGAESSGIALVNWAAGPLANISTAMKEAYKDTGLLGAAIIGLGGAADHLFGDAGLSQAQKISKQMAEVQSRMADTAQRLNDAQDIIGKSGENIRAAILAGLQKDFNNLAELAKALADIKRGDEAASKKKAADEEAKKKREKETADLLALEEVRKKAREEWQKREDRLRAEDIKGWIAHADAVFKEADELNIALARINGDHWKHEAQLRDDDIKGWIKAIEKETDEYEDNLREMGKGTKSFHETQIDNWKGTIDNIEGAFRGGFQRLLEGGTGTWKAFTQGLANTFKTTVADVMYQAFAKPLVIQVIGQLAGLTGLTGLQMAANAAGGTSGASSLGSLLGNAGGLSGITGSAIGSIGSLLGSSTISAFGSGLSGTAVGTLAGQGATIAGAETGLGSLAGSSASGLGSSLAAAGPYIAAALAIYALYKAFAAKSGGAKVGGSFGGAFDATGALTSSNTNSLFGLKPDESTGNAATQTLATTTAKAYFDLVKQFGGTSQGISLGIGYDSDPKGTAPNRITALLKDALGNTLFGESGRAVGRDSAQLGPELQLSASRALLAALQASKLPDDIANLINNVTASGATQTQIDDVIQRATAMHALFGAIGVSLDTVAAPIKTAIELIHDQGAALAEFARTSDRSAKSLGDLTTATAQYRANVTALIQQYEDAKGAIGKTINDTIRGFVFGTLDTAGQYGMLQSEAAGLRTGLGSMTDSAMIASTIQQIAQLSNQAFGLLDPAAQKAQLDEFIAGLKDAQGVADTRLADLQQAAADAANESLENTRKNIAQETANAATNLAAAQLNYQAAQLAAVTASNGIQVNVGQPAVEQVGP